MSNWVVGYAHQSDSAAVIGQLIARAESCARDNSGDAIVELLRRLPTKYLDDLGG